MKWWERKQFFTPEDTGDTSSNDSTDETAEAKEEEVEDVSSSIDVASAQARLDEVEQQRQASELQNQIAHLQQEIERSRAVSAAEPTNAGSSPDSGDETEDEQDAAFRRLKQVSQDAKRLPEIESQMKTLTSKFDRLIKQLDVGQTASRREVMQAQVSSWMTEDVFSKDEYFGTATGKGIEKILRKEVDGFVKNMDPSRALDPQYDRLRVALGNRITEFKRSVPASASKKGSVSQTGQSARLTQEQILEQDKIAKGSINAGGSSPPTKEGDTVHKEITANDVYRELLATAKEKGMIL